MKGGDKEMKPMRASPTGSQAALASRTGRFTEHAQKTFLNKFAEGPLNYWVSFCSDTAVAAFFLAWSIARSPVAGVQILLLFPVGFFVWTFSEYVFHRWVYHQKKGIFGSGHRMHHEEEKAYIAMPWFVSAVTLFAIWYGLVIELGWTAFSALLAGWMAGFVFYSWVHHAHHHWSLKNGWMRSLRAWHRVHHRFPDRNFGVTMRFWDTIFGTRLKPGDRPPSVH